MLGPMGSAVFYSLHSSYLWLLGQKLWMFCLGLIEAIVLQDRNPCRYNCHRACSDCAALHEVCCKASPSCQMFRPQAPQAAEAGAFTSKQALKTYTLIHDWLQCM